MILKNGAKPLASFIDYDPGDGMPEAAGVVLAISALSGDYVVWNCSPDSDGNEFTGVWNCTSGDYFDRGQADMAWNMFEIRMLRMITGVLRKGLKT